MRTAPIAVCLALPLLGGCVAKAVVGVVTLPVKVASKTIDLATTSQSEADQKRGRELRRQEERLGGLERNYQRHASQCERGESSACAKADADLAEIERLGGPPPP